MKRKKKWNFIKSNKKSILRPSPKPTPVADLPVFELVSTLLISLTATIKNRNFHISRIYLSRFHGANYGPALSGILKKGL